MSRRTAVEADTNRGDTAAKWPDSTGQLYPSEGSTPQATNAGGTDVETGCVTTLAVLAVRGTVSRDFWLHVFS